jgi:sialidase-1
MQSSQPTTSPGTTVVGFSRRIFVASAEFPRYSEADVIQLRDGRLQVALGRKDGSADIAPGTIIGAYSEDGGLSWSDEAHVIQERWGEKSDIYSTSFCRSLRGIHLFFMTRGKEPRRDTQVFQIVSSDEGKSWSEPERVTPREGYHVMNNARVVRVSGGRMIAPCAYVETDIDKQYTQQRIYCAYSDDDGQTWKESSDLIVEKHPLMEPGVAECADGSLFMIIRTAMGTVWQARSSDKGATWTDLKSSELPAPAAPATLVRAPDSKDLWLFWCDKAKGNWKGRVRIVFASSSDNGRSWSQPRTVEEDPKGSFGYVSFLVVNKQALLTYYDWRDHGQPNFQKTSLRERLIPLAWFRGDVTPPVFRTSAQPVVRQDQPYEGKIVSINSGVIVDKDLWRLWYTTGVLDAKGEKLKVCYAQSRDAGLTWEKRGVVLPPEGAEFDAYHPCVFRDGALLVMYVWRREPGGASGLYRYISQDDGVTWLRNPRDAVILAWWTKQAKESTDGRVSNDAFDVLHDDNGTWTYFAACLEKASDPREDIKHDNIPGQVRRIGRAVSADGAEFSAVDVVLRPDYAMGDPYDTQFYGIHVFRYRKFYLGILFTYHVQSQVIVPEWAWSHDGVSWARTRVPCVSLGDEGAFDSRMIVFGRVIMHGDELVLLYGGMDWRHNAFKKGAVGSAIGRATLPRAGLDAWIESLPQP